MRSIGALLAAGLTMASLVVNTEASVGAALVSAGAPPDTGLRNCRTRGEGTAPIRMSVTRDDVRFGPLVIGFVRNRVAAGATERPDWPFVAKAPLLLPAHSRVVLAIAPEAARLAAFQHQGGWCRRCDSRRARRGYKPSPTGEPSAARRSFPSPSASSSAQLASRWSSGSTDASRRCVASFRSAVATAERTQASPAYVQFPPLPAERNLSPPIDDYEIDVVRGIRPR